MLPNCLIFYQARNKSKKTGTLREEKKTTYELMLVEGADAISVLYERYGKRLFYYGANKWNVNEDDNWDLIYKTLFKVCEKIENYEFDSEKGFAAIVYKIYINYLRKHYRKQKQIGERLTFESFDEKFFDDYDNPHGNKTEKKIQKRIVDADIKMREDKDEVHNPYLIILEAELEKLEDWQRMLLLLKSQNMPYKEIGEFINRPAGQLKVYYARLKTRLTKNINEQLAQQKNN